MHLSFVSFFLLILSDQFFRESQDDLFQIIDVQKNKKIFFQGLEILFVNAILCLKVSYLSSNQTVWSK